MCSRLVLFASGSLVGFTGRNFLVYPSMQAKREGDVEAHKMLASRPYIPTEMRVKLAIIPERMEWSGPLC